MGESFWQKDSLITHKLFISCLFRYIYYLAKFTFFSGHPLHHFNTIFTEPAENLKISGECINKMLHNVTAFTFGNWSSAGPEKKRDFIFDTYYHFLVLSRFSIGKNFMLWFVSCNYLFLTLWGLIILKSFGSHCYRKKKTASFKPLLSYTEKINQNRMTSNHLNHYCPQLVLKLNKVSLQKEIKI